MGMSPHAFWYEMTVKEFWLAHDAWAKMERARLGISDDAQQAQKDEPPTDDEYEALIEADKRHQMRLKQKGG